MFSTSPSPISCEGNMKTTSQILLIACLWILAVPAIAQTPACPEPPASADVWKQALLQMDQYRNTYVLLYADRNAEQITAFGPPASAEMKIAALGSSASEVARKHGITVSSEYPIL